MLFEMGRFNLAGTVEETRMIVAESEEEAYEMMGEPFDGSYWEILAQASGKSDS